MANFLSSFSTYPLEIVAPDVATDLSVVPASDPMGGPYAPGETFEIAGTLKRLDTYHGVPGAHISVSYNGVNVGSAVTNEYGVYSISTSIPAPGSYTLRADFAGMTIPGLTLRASNASFRTTIGVTSALPILAILGAVALLFFKK